MLVPARRLPLILGFLFFFDALPVSGGSARAQTCELSLVLAIDVSSSVDDGEYQLQSDGLAYALTHPSVVEAIDQIGGLWLTAFEWSGRRNQQILLPWTFLRGTDAITAAAATIQAKKRSTSQSPTALGHALGYGATLHQRAPMPCLRRVIDMAGDGVNNEGFPPESAYSAFPFGDITVNGLVIKGDYPDPEYYYRTRVLRGPGAFLEVAQGYEDYARAMRRKLLREIGSNNFVMLEQ